MILFLPVLIFLGLLTRDLFFEKKISILMLFMSFLLVPATTPFFTELFGYSHFTMQNHQLQSKARVSYAIFTIVLFSLSVLTSYYICSYTNTRIKTLSTRQIFFPQITNPLIMVMIAVISFYTLEDGNLLTSTYQDMKSGNSQFSSTINQVMNILLCLTISSVKIFSRSTEYNTVNISKLNKVAFILVCLLLILISRRTLVLGIIFIYIMISQKKVNFLSFLLGSILLALLWFIGEVRNVGIIPAVIEGVPFIAERETFNLPGGASQLISSAISLLYLEEQNILPIFTFFQWPAYIFESALLENSNLHYNGGMLLTSVIYVNFRLVGCIFIGLLFGFYLFGIDSRFRNQRYTMVDLGFLLVLPNLLWYHPIGPIKLMLALFLIDCFSRAILPKKKGSNNEEKT